MKSSLTRTRWAAIGAAVAVSLGGGTLLVANAASTGTQFTAIEPCRLLDTRPPVAPDGNVGIRQESLLDSTKSNTDDNDITVVFDSTAVKNGNKFTRKYGSSYLPIMGECDAEFASGGELISATASKVKAVLLNVTVVGANTNGTARATMATNGFITVYPWKALSQSGSPLRWNRPFISNVNPVAALSTVHNNVTVELGTIASPWTIPNVACSTGATWADPGAEDCSGLKAFRVYNEAGSNHIIIDVLGYYSIP